MTIPYRARAVSCALMLFCAGAQAQEMQDDGDFLSRVTIATPLFTRHVPHDSLFNDENWGGFVLVALDRQWTIVGGDFINSYNKNTAFAGVAWLPINLDFSRVEVDAGGMLGVDLNQGYKGFNRLDPALGALAVKIGGHYFDDPDYQFFNRIGGLVTVIPGVGSGTSTAINFALTFRL